MSRRRILFLVFMLCAVMVGSIAAQDDLDCDAVLEVWQIQGAGADANCARARVETEDNVVTSVGALGFFM